MIQALQQGDEIGMCGLYSLLNFLVREKRWLYWQDHRTSLRLLLDACASLGWLNAVTLTQRLEEHQLKRVIDLLFNDYRVEFETIYVDDLRPALKARSSKDLIDRVVQRGGSVLVHCDAREHWMMATGMDDGIVLLDSSTPGEALSLADSKDKLSIVSGFAILPRKRQSLGSIL